MDGMSATKIPISYGDTQGMKPKAWKAYLEIANQRVKNADTKPVSDNPNREEGKKSEEEFIEKAKKRFDQAAEAESEIRKDSLEDLKFFAGEQWDDSIKRARQQDGRPCLTINRLPQFVRQVTNEQRQNRPSIQVNPVDDGADVETAEIIQGLIRHIEYDSAADAAYDTAFFGAATYGFGYFRVTTEYSGPLSFEQDIKIVRIRNPFTVYCDPTAKEPDYSDMAWALIVESLSKDKFKAQYPDAELSKMEDWLSIGDNGWVAEDSCRIAEYFWKEEEPATLVQLITGEVMLKDEWDSIAEAFKLNEKQKKEEIAAERETTITKIKWAKINGIEILEQTEWAGRWIPIIKVVGEELDIDGELQLKGIVRDAKEPQRQFNFMKSATTEAIALAPKAPFVAAEGQLAGYERQWQQANTRNFAYLQYKPVSINGQIAPPPQRMNAEPAIQAINMAMMESADDLKAVTGIYDASLGAQGNETSGKAILARQQQSQGSNFHFLDNLTRAIRHTGRILLDLIPKIYDTQRVIRIIGDDGEQKVVTVNGKQQPSKNSMQQMQAIEKVYDLTVGKYDVTISTGPSYQSRRQEAVSSMIDLTGKYPQLMGVAGDLLVKNMDWPEAQEIARRLKASMPPQIVGDENSQLPPEVQQQVQQMQQQTQQLQQQLQSAQADLQKNISVKKLETDSREKIAAGEQRIKEIELQIEAAKVQALILSAQVKADAQATDAEAQRAYNAMSKIVDQNHEAAMQQMQHEHSMESAMQYQPTQEDDGYGEIDQPTEEGAS